MAENNSTILDRVVAYFSPKRGLRRIRARRALRIYDGATVGRRGSSWRARSTSANTEISEALPLLRARARDLVRNTAQGARIAEILVNNIVGEGLRPVPDTGSDRIDNLVEKLWNDWQEFADVEGIETFDGMQVLAMRSQIEGGECVFRFIDQRLEDIGPEARVPFQLQLLEGDHIDHGRDGAVATTERSAPPRSRLGVGLGDYDRRLGLWLFPQHPGEMTLLTGNGKSNIVSSFVLQEELVHFFTRTRAGQVRGVPWFAPILQTAREYADFCDAVNVKARIEACFGAFITQGDEADSVMDPAQGDGTEPSIDNPDAMVSTMEPGMMKLLRPGQDVKFAQPTSTSHVESIMMFSLMSMAAGVGVNYDELSGDLRGANYSSLRAGKLGFKRRCSQFQQTVLIPRLCQPVWRRFIEKCILAGELKPRKGGYRCEWITPAWESVNPKLDLAGEELSVRSGRMTPQEYYASWGSNWRKNLADIKKFYEKCDELGVEVDIDPRKFTRVGIKQQLPQKPSAGGAAAPGAEGTDSSGGDSKQVTLVDANGEPVDMSVIQDAADAADDT